MSDLDVSKSTFYACIERENEELKQKYDLLSKQYNKLLERYQELLSKTKKLETYNAEEFEVEEE